MIVDVLSVTTRALSFIATFQAAGMALFVAIFGHLIRASLRHIQRLAIASALVAMGLLVAQYVLEAARMSGDLAGVMDGSLQDLVLHSSTAATLALRLAGLGLLVVALPAARRAPATRTGGVPVSLFGILLVVGSFALMGHTTMHPHRWALVLLLLAHLLIVSFWFGALVPLYVASKEEPTASAGAIVEAFSRLALWIVPALFVAGAILAGILLKTFAALRTTYGELLLVKLALFMLLMILAALNRWRLGPAISQGRARALAAFRCSLGVEYVLITIVLCVTAALTSLYSPD